MKNTQSDNGQALVEVALVLPILLALVLGAAEFGRLWYMGIEVSDAAHAGAAYGAQNHATASDNSGKIAAAANDQLNVPGATAAATHFCSSSAEASTSSCPCSLTDTDAAGACPNTCSGGNTFEYVQVGTSAQINTLLPSYFGNKKYTLTGCAVMRVEQ
jgi:Flp pilus assembly protein TadG